MAALDTPWMTSISDSSRLKPGDSNNASSSSSEQPTVAAFSPATSASSPSSAKQRSAILVHQKTPLLIATPPQVTRALAYSHPFLLPLNKIAGLVTWTTGDPWESFLLVTAYWAAVLYGDVLVRWVAPTLLVSILVLAMYARRYSPLSSTGWARDYDMKSQTQQRKDNDTKLRHHKSLDDIVETLNLFTSRCNILLEPLLRLTDFLSTQRTATSTTTRPALITLFMRLVFLTPFWFLLTLPPLHIITTKRVILVLGTTGLTWHSRPARVSRTILWRSRSIRRMLSFLTGLQLSPPNPERMGSLAATSKAMRDANALAASLKGRKKKGKTDTRAKVDGRPEGIRFTFVLFENQRRWLGIGWTTLMLAYERAAWTDEDLVVSPPKEKFELPVIDGGIGVWRWCEGSEWTVEGPGPAEDTAGTTKSDSSDQGGWIFYDTQWRFPKRQDGWGRYTRRRKWIRDAELVEIEPSSESSSINGSSLPPRPDQALPGSLDRTNTNTPSKLDRQGSYNDTPGSGAKRRTWFGRPRNDTTDSLASSSNTPQKSPMHQSQSSSDLSSKPADSVNTETVTTTGTNSTVPSTSAKTSSAKKRNRASTAATINSIGSSTRSLDSGSGGKEREDPRDDDGYVPLQYRGRLHGVVNSGWGVGEDLGMELG